MVDFRVSYIIQILKSTNKYFFSLENLNVHLLINVTRDVQENKIYASLRGFEATKPPCLLQLYNLKRLDLWVSNRTVQS